MKAGLAESVSYRRIAILMIPNVAVGAVQEGVVLLKMGTEAAAAGSFEDSFGVLSRLLTFLLFHVLLKLFFVGDRLGLGLCPVLLDCIQISIVVQSIDFGVQQSQSQVLPYQTSHVFILDDFGPIEIGLGFVPYSLPNALESDIDSLLTSAH